MVSPVWPAESRVFHRFQALGYPNIQSGQGVRLRTVSGETILDACSGGAMVTCLGYGVQEVISAATDQAHRISYIYNEYFTNDAAEGLAARLIEVVAPAMQKVRFVSTGSEANETALRLARSYHVERGEPSRYRVISPAQAYHGSTMGTLALTGRTRTLQYPYGEYLTDHLHIPPSPASLDPKGEIALSALDRVIDEAGPETIAAFLCEPISASALPGYAPAAAFFEGLAERSERYGFLVWFDEIVTGMGRVGSWLAADQLPIRPDIVTIGKGLGAGYAPLAAALCGTKVYEAIARGSGYFDLGHTWDAAPLPCAVGLAVVDVLVKNDLVASVAARGPRLLADLRSALTGIDVVGEVRGQGFLVGVDLVDPRDGCSVLPISMDAASLFDGIALDHGLLVTATHPNADGFAGDQALIAPAYVSTDEDLAEMITRFVEAMREVDGRIKAQLKSATTARSADGTC